MNSLLNQNQIVYSLDSSTLFDAFKWYPPENFPPFWRKIEGLINSDRLKMAEVAFDEVMKDERVREWCNQNQLIPSLKWETDDSIQNKTSTSGIPKTGRFSNWKICRGSVGCCFSNNIRKLYGANGRRADNGTSQTKNP